MRKLSDIKKIVTFGDSITTGLSASSQDRCWSSRLVALLQQFTPHSLQLINQGVGASIVCKETPAYQYAANPCALERLQQDVIDLAPDLLIIAYGTNDSRGGTTPAIFRRDYQIMIDRIKAQIDPMIVVVNAYYMHESIYRMCKHWDYGDYDLTAEYNLILQQIARKNQLAYADVFHAQKGIEESVSEDHCHPNDLGHLLIANQVFKTIAANCIFD